ncbi:MAG TPA: hypothetical protein VME68_02645 [Acidobacteriaceae bacterium]|nr:hypothetical protein [Acidobacteriaceae bacterium]
MKALTNSGLLDLWERGSNVHPLDRALLSIAAAEPGTSYDALADWSLGSRNAALARLRRACFGPALAGWVACPQCGERLEFSMDTGMLLEEANDAGRELVVDGRRFRPLTSRDLASIAAERDERDAARKLLRRSCAENAEFGEEELGAIGELLAEADPLAETLLGFSCAACEHQWQEPLDIATWLWTEVDARARRLLHDVHTLATAYGWTEREILSLSEPRRALYLEMVQA